MALKPASTFTAVRTPIADPQTGAVRWEWVKKFQEWELKLQNGLDEIGQFIGNIGASATVGNRAGTIGTALQHIDATGVLAASAISGIISSGTIPAASLGGLGGVEANNPVPHQWVNSIDTSGTPILSQPGYGDIAGTPVLPASAGAAAHNWLNSYTAGTGAFTESQPAFADISGTVAAGQLPANVPVVSFGVGAPGGASTEGYIYFDTTASPYHGYVWHAGAWQIFS